MIRRLSFVALFLLCAALAAALASCVHAPSSSSFPLESSSFTEYRQTTNQWLLAHRRFQTDDRETEAALNAPQEWRPAGTPRAGLLLIHGLGDSAFSFADVGPRLAQHGVLVRALLLPGNGTRPADMLDVSVDDWRRLVAVQKALLQSEVSIVYLGGFSNGANLALLEALDDDSVAGVLLFSPAFKSKFSYDWLVPWIAPFKSWLRDPDDRRPQQSPVRYTNVPVNAFAQFYASSTALRRTLSQKAFDKPALLISVEHDSVVDVQTGACLFERYFTHPRSRLIWYGTPPACADARMLVRPDALPEQRISRFSHMGVLFSPDNPYYGTAGAWRICENGQDNDGNGNTESDDAYRRCRHGEPVWYSEWGYTTPGRYHARLTFNPYFDWQMDAALDVLNLRTP